MTANYASLSKPHKTTKTKSSLGKWCKDRRTKKIKYISLTGKTYSGREAMLKHKQDQEASANPLRGTRGELATNIHNLNANVVQELLRQYSVETNHQLNSSKRAKQHPLSVLTAWGIPTRVVNQYARHNTTRLFDWQIDCLTCDDCAALDGGNLIYSAPTSGGKTMVAELLMLRRLATRPGTILFVVPFVALAEEKAESFRERWSDLNVGVKVGLLRCLWWLKCVCDVLYSQQPTTIATTATLMTTTGVPRRRIVDHGDERGSNGRRRRGCLHHRACQHPRKSGSSKLYVVLCGC